MSQQTKFEFYDPSPNFLRALSLTGNAQDEDGDVNPWCLRITLSDQRQVEGPVERHGADWVLLLVEKSSGFICNPPVQRFFNAAHIVSAEIIWV
ncbi:MAG TPA: hypothetical protein VN719_02870 [Gemmatimonadales bacterium]|nr:hypothetical protein [Gemmatimonadales bacterium]